MRNLLRVGVLALATMTAVPVLAVDDDVLFKDDAASPLSFYTRTIDIGGSRRMGVVGLGGVAGAQIGISGAPIFVQLASLGAQAGAASLSVVPALDATFLISGTVTANLGGLNGAATEATLAAMSGKIPASLGPKAAASSLSVAPPTDGGWPAWLKDGLGTPITSSAAGANRPLHVILLESGGGVVSLPNRVTFGSTAPTLGMPIGGTDGTNFRAPTLYPGNTGTPGEYTFGAQLRQSGASGSVEVGTAANPLRTNPTGTTPQPVNLNDGGGTALTSSAAGATRPLDIIVRSTDGTAITNFGGSGGTASTFGATTPAQGTASGFGSADGTMRPGWAVDGDSGAAQKHIQAVIIAKSADGGPVEVGTTAAPFVTQPVEKVTTSRFFLGVATGGYVQGDAIGPDTVADGASAVLTIPVAGAAGDAIEITNMIIGVTPNAYAGTLRVVLWKLTPDGLGGNCNQNANWTDSNGAANNFLGYWDLTVDAIQPNGVAGNAYAMLTMSHTIAGSDLATRNIYGCVVIYSNSPLTTATGQPVVFAMTTRAVKQ
jgi:hypothetical protein